MTGSSAPFFSGVFFLDLGLHDFLTHSRIGLVPPELLRLRDRRREALDPSPDDGGGHPFLYDGLPGAGRPFLSSEKGLFFLLFFLVLYLNPYAFQLR